MARTLILAAVGVLLAAALAWNAAEAHYQGCIAAVDALPDTRSALDAEYGNQRSDEYLTGVQRRLDDCSRIP